MTSGFWIIRRAAVKACTQWSDSPSVMVFWPRGKDAVMESLSTCHGWKCSPIYNWRSMFYALFFRGGGVGARGFLQSESENYAVVAAFFFSFLHTLKLTYASGGKLVSGIFLTNKQNGQLTCSSVQPERCQRCTRLFFMDLSVQIDLTLVVPFISLLIFCVQSFINLMHFHAVKIWTFHRNYTGLTSI